MPSTARSVNALFDMPTFAEHYAILGVQRATKILGIFARLDKRDRKPQYLQPFRASRPIWRKGLAHPALDGAAGLVPGLFAGRASGQGRMSGAGSSIKSRRRRPAAAIRPGQTTAPPVQRHGAGEMDRAADGLAQSLSECRASSAECDGGK